MADKIFENNQVSIVGEIVSDFRFSHEVYGEGFYVVDVAVNRLSNFMDYIPLMISERLIDVRTILVRPYMLWDSSGHLTGTRKKRTVLFYPFL